MCGVHLGIQRVQNGSGLRSKVRIMSIETFIDRLLHSGADHFEFPSLGFGDPQVKRRFEPAGYVGHG